MFNVKIIGVDLTDNADALASKRQVSAVGCRFYTVLVYNTGANDQYVQVFDLAAEPASGAGLVPKFQEKVPADSLGWIDYPAQSGRPMRNGLFVGMSTTKEQYTATGVADCIIDTGYRKTS